MSHLILLVKADFSTKFKTHIEQRLYRHWKRSSPKLSLSYGSIGLRWSLESRAYSNRRWRVQERVRDLLDFFLPGVPKSFAKPKKVWKYAFIAFIKLRNGSNSSVNSKDRSISACIDAQLPSNLAGLAPIRTSVWYWDTKNSATTTKAGPFCGSSHLRTYHAMRWEVWAKLIRSSSLWSYRPL